MAVVELRFSAINHSLQIHYHRKNIHVIIWLGRFSARKIKIRSMVYFAGNYMRGIFKKLGFTAEIKNPLRERVLTNLSGPDGNTKGVN